MFHTSFRNTDLAFFPKCQFLHFIFCCVSCENKSRTELWTSVFAEGGIKRKQKYLFFLHILELPVLLTNKLRKHFNISKRSGRAINSRSYAITTVGLDRPKLK